MAYLRISEVQTAARTALYPLQKHANRALAEDAQSFSTAVSYDIFLSHSFDDAEIIYGVKKRIESLRLSVYVDWIDDPKLNRSNVTVKTAARLRARMKNCSSLVYAHSANSPDSVWMPWELGYFDALKPKHVWIMPLVVNSDSEFKGQEYLGLYPTVKKLTDLYGRQDLGFDQIGPSHGQIPLAKAVRETGVFF